MSIFRLPILIFSFFILCLPASSNAARMKGKIFSISRKAKAVEIFDLTYGRVKVFSYSDKTKFINARSIRDFSVNEKVELRYEGKATILSMKKMLVWVPEKKVIRTRQLANLVAGNPENYLLIDTRTWYDYQKGHLPTAIWVPVDRFANYLHLLPINKKKLIVFYSEGITDDKAIKVARLTELSGYLNTRVYIFGMSAWKKDRQSVVVDNSWLIRNLDPNKVLIDVRDRNLSLKSHIKGAVAIEATNIIRMGEQSISDRKKSRTRLPARVKFLPALPDKTVQIILYGIESQSPDILTAYKELLSWEYENVAVLNGGFSTWEKSYPVIQGPAKTHIRYKKYVAEGTIIPKEFEKTLKEKSVAIFLDVRTSDEANTGILPNAIHIPLSQLETRHKELSRSEPIIIYCATGMRAHIAYNLLKSEGFKNARFLNSTVIINRTGSYEIRSR